MKEYASRIQPIASISLPHLPLAKLSATMYPIKSCTHNFSTFPSDGRDLFRLHVRGLVPQILEQGRGEVALTEAGDDDDDALAGILRSAADPDGGRDGSTGRDAAEHTLLGGHLPCHGHGVLSGHLDDLIEEAGVGVAGDETSTDALDLMRAGLATGKDGGLLGLNSHDLERRVERLEVLAASGQSSAGADSTDEDVNLSIGCLFYLFMMILGDGECNVWKCGLGSMQ